MKSRNIHIGEWLSFLDGLPFYSFYQSPYWALALENAGYCRVATKLFKGSHDIVVPMVETSKCGLKSRYSMFNGYGGLLCNGAIPLDETREVVDSIKSGSLSVVLSPYPYEVWGNIPDGFSRRHTFTHTLDIDNLTNVYNKFSHACRKNLNRAGKENLKLTIGSVDDVHSYYRIYLDVMNHRRSGEVAVSERFFAALLKIGSSKCKLLFVEKDNVKIAGVIMLYGKGESFQYHAASLFEYEYARPSNFWEWEVIKYAFDNGYKVHNFGSSEGLEGVKRFKESFGANELRYDYFIYRHPISGLYSKVAGRE